ncbi:hypothetical protein OIU77_014261, partial [Salix suchowensis]
MVYFFLAILANYDKAQEVHAESAEAFQVQFKQRETRRGHGGYCCTGKEAVFIRCFGLCYQRFPPN